MDLRNRVAIVTGASRGIGVAICEALARKGAHLALAARSEGGLKETAGRLERFGTNVVTIPTDVTSKEDLEHLVRRAGEELGPIDVLVNNAGTEHYSYFEKYDLDVIETMVRTNQIAPQWLSRLVLPAMIQQGRGHIVNIASMAGKTPVPYNAVYSSTKHALVGFSHSLREEMRRYGIGVSVVCPGFVRDAGMFNDWSKGKEPPGLASSVPLAKVAHGTVKAIEDNLAEVVVAPVTMRYLDLIQAISPSLTALIGRKSGGYDFLENTAVKAWEDR